jgi:hypothetical protein
MQRWRGAANWPEVVATVVTTEVISEGGYRQPPPSVRLTFYYRDTTNSLQSGELTVDSLTSLFNLEVNDTFPIHINPQHPQKFYSSESSSFFKEFRRIFWVGVVIFVLASVILFILRR